VKGYLWTVAGRAAAPSDPAQVPMAPWESMAVDAVGNAIEFWGFKRNQGRVWALLYLRDQALTAAEIEAALGLSKGGVSMLLRDLERWGVVLRGRATGGAAWRYGAQTDLMAMVSRVLQEREGQLLSRIRADLLEARKLAQQGGVARHTLQRLSRMATLAEQTDRALKVFLKTARLDVAGVFQALQGGARQGDS
jgi:DNA-binding transcriptional regulator GbsR (MarR family)